MGLPLLVVDAFTSVAFRGNPAAVVLLDEPAAEHWMQAVAAEMKHSETAFCVPRPSRDEGFDLRWFTPQTEVDLCGHATLASAHALWEWGSLDPSQHARFSTRSGPLGAQRHGDMIEMDFPSTPAEPVDVPPGLLEALGVALDVDAAGVVRNDFYVLVEVDDPGTVRDLAPDLEALRDVDAPAVIVTARDTADSEFDIVSRVFAPNVGIPEDPVTGSAHCVLAPYWRERIGTELRCLQASERGGMLHTRLAGDRVAIGGAAVTVLRGELVP
jgi:PhzF family phenazine biosynthesis protein